MYNQTDTIEIFEDMGISEKELEQKLKQTLTQTLTPTPELDNTPEEPNKILNYIKSNKLLITFAILLIILLIIYFTINPSYKYQSNNIQSGGAIPRMPPMGMGGMGGMGGMDDMGGGEENQKPSKLMSPVTSTFNLVISVVGKFLKLILLLFMIILVPTVPILIYCLVAYFVIRKFLNMFKTIR